MEHIREHLIYKNTSINVCLLTIPPQEQYELFRIILESKTDDVSICKHNSSNKYIDMLIQKLNISMKDCSIIPHSKRIDSITDVYGSSHP
jgi:hypothetical protein